MSATEMPLHVSIVFRQLYDDINSAKRQQWTMTNYCVLILAAIYAVNLPSDYDPFLMWLTFIIALVGSILLLRIHYHIARSRIRLNKLHKIYFTESELRDIGLSDYEIKGLGEEKRWRQYLRAYQLGWEFLRVLIGVLWIGALLVSLMLSGADAESASL